MAEMDFFSCCCHLQETGEKNAGAVNMPTINHKTLVDAMSLTDAKRSVHTKNSSDAKWFKDAKRVAYTRRRVSAAKPVSPA